MKEAFTGAMLTMIAKKLPDFGPEFDAFAADLKTEAERRAPPAVMERPEEPEPAEPETMDRPDDPEEQTMERPEE